MLDYIYNRHVIPDRHDKRGTIPIPWLMQYGRLALPPKWTEDLWHMQDDEAKRFIYRSCVDLTWFFLKVFLPYESETEGEKCPKTLPEYQLDYAGELQAKVPLEVLPYDRKPRDDSVRKMCAVFPTGHFKSTMTCEMLPLYLMGSNPCITLVAISSTKEKAQRFITSAKGHITNNEVFRWVFGDLRAEDVSGPWKMDAIQIDRPVDRSAPTLSVMGCGGAIQGERYDCAFVDDVMTLQMSRTELQRDRVWDWLNHNLMTRLHPHRRAVFVVGSRMHGDDTYARIQREAETKKTWTYFERSVVVGGTWPPGRIDNTQPYSADNVIVPKDLKVLWPKFWTPEKIVEDFVDDPHTFARSRLNIPQDPASKIFRWDMLEQCLADGDVDRDGNVKLQLSRWPEQYGRPEKGSALYDQYRQYGIDCTNVKLIISVDPAATAKEPGNDPDYTVIQLWGMDPRHNYRILLNQWRAQTSDPKAIGVKLAEWCRVYEPHKLLIEAAAVDKLFARTMQDVVGFPVNIRPMGAAKNDMIEAFRDLIQSGLALIPWSQDRLGTRATFNSFIQELSDYPSGNHDDTLSAAVHAYDMMKSPELHQVKSRVIRRDGVGPEPEPAKELEKAVRPSELARMLGFDSIAAELDVLDEGSELAKMKQEVRDRWTKERSAAMR